MKQLTQSEFEAQIRRILNGEISRKKLAKELEMNMRTLNNKIMGLADANPELYEEFIKRFPYKPKEIEIDIENLIISVIRYGMQKVVEQTGVSERTISRKVKKLEKMNPRLYKIYKNRNRELSFSDKVYIDEKISEIGLLVPERTEIAKRKRDLQETIVQFEELVKSGMSQAQAARTMGYDGYPTIWKKYMQLERINMEEKVGQKSKSGPEKNYKDSLKVSTLSNIKTTDENNKNRESREQGKNEVER